MFPARPGLQVLGCLNGQVYSGTVKRVRQHYMPVALSNQEDQGGCQGSFGFASAVGTEIKEERSEKTENKTPSKELPGAWSSLTHSSSCTSACDTWSVTDRFRHTAPKPRWQQESKGSPVLCPGGTSSNSPPDPILYNRWGPGPIPAPKPSCSTLGTSTDVRTAEETPGLAARTLHHLLN